jgi:hypothetical protein
MVKDLRIQKIQGDDRSLVTGYVNVSGSGHRFARLPGKVLAATRLPEGTAPTAFYAGSLGGSSASAGNIINFDLSGNESSRQFVTALIRLQADDI